MGVTNQDPPVVFQPGKWLWLFTGFFLPLFLLLGVWQLNRAEEKEQLLAMAAHNPISLQQIDWADVPVNRPSLVTGRVLKSPLFLMDNKTHDGQAGYEVFALVNTTDGALAVSFGWVKGSLDRSQLPTLSLPDVLTAEPITLRQPPENAVFGVDANVRHAHQADIWITQA
jgi:cytochrome oxidase assembly protein ShyY1